MTSLPEQFSAAAGQSQAKVKAQFEAQFDFFQNFSSQAIESASRVAALNLAISRDSVERSTRAAQSLIGSRDPRDLLVLKGHAEEQVRSLFDYSRELIGIASGIKLYAAPLQALAEAQAKAPQLATPLLKTVQAVAEAPAPAPAKVAETEVVVVADPEPVAAAKEAEPAPAVPEAELVVVAEPQAEPEPAAEALAAEPAPVAEPTVIAAAAGNGEAQAGVAPRPASAPVPAETTEVRVPKLATGSSRRKK